MKKLFLCVLLLCLAVLSFCCWHSAMQQQVSRLPDGSLDLHGRHIVVYVSLRDEVGRAYLELFKKKTGCTYEYLYLPTQAALARIRSEHNHPQADIVIGGTSHAQIQAGIEGLTAQYISPNAAIIPDRFKDPDGRWTGIATTPLAIVVNRARWQREFAPLGKKLPLDYADLLDPDYRGQIVFSDPNTAGTGYTMLAYLDQKLSPDKTLDFYRKLRQNTVEFTFNGYTSVEKVASGECLVGLSFLDDQTSLRISGFDIISIVPPECAWTMDAVSIIQNGPNQEPAKCFIDFCLQKETQEQISRIAYSVPTRPDAAPAEPPPGETFDLYTAFDFARAGRDQSALLEKWNNL
jgi:iron(III) transport system substrate-binding protein